MKIIRLTILVDCEIHCICNITRKIKKESTTCIASMMQLNYVIFKRKKLMNALRAFVNELF